MLTTNVRLATLAKGRGPYSTRQIEQLQRWLDDDWESHDVNRDAVRVIRRLLATIYTVAPEETPSR